MFVNFEKYRAKLIRAVLGGVRIESSRNNLNDVAGVLLKGVLYSFFPTKKWMYEFLSFYCNNENLLSLLCGDSNLKHS